MAKNTPKKIILPENDYENDFGKEESEEKEISSSNNSNIVPKEEETIITEEAKEEVKQKTPPSTKLEPQKGTASDDEIKRGLDANSTVDKDISIRQLQNMIPLIDPKECTARTIKIPNQALENFHKIKSIMGKDFSIDAMLSVSLLFSSIKLFDDMKNTDKFKAYMKSLK